LKSRSQESLVLELIEQIYDAAVDQKQLSRVLETLIQSTNSPSGLIYACNRRTQKVRLLTDPGLLPDNFDLYEHYYASIDPWNAYLLSHPAGQVTLSQQCLTDSELQRTEFYNDFLKPLHFFYSVGGIFSVSGDWTYSFGIQRSRNQGAYGEAAPLIATLFPHLKRAIGMAEKFHGLNGCLDASRNAMDQLAFGVMLLDDSLRVQYLNNYLTEIIREQRVLTISCDRPRAVDYQKNQLLQCFLSAIEDPGKNREGVGSRPCSMLLGRPESGGQLTLFARPARRQTNFPKEPGDTTSVIVFVFSDDNTTTPGMIFREIYGLSPMQSVVCEKLVEGLTLREIADLLGVKKETVRSHLKMIFQRTGVRRQSELIRLLVNQCAFLKHD
jgi:DNA-binding CsgD family transcriptional regulator